MDTTDWGKDALPHVPPGTRVPAICASVAPRVHRRPDMYPVLVVDDDEAIRDTLGMLLDDTGFATQAAVTGSEALALLRAASTPLVVLLDLIMPEPDGRSVLRVVSADQELSRRHAFIIVTAAAVAVVDAAQADIGRLGARLILDTVRKPFDIDAVVTAVERSQRRLRSTHGTHAARRRDARTDAEQ